MPARQCAEMAKALKLVESGMKPKDAAKEAGVSVRGVYWSMKRKSKETSDVGARTEEAKD